MSTNQKMLLNTESGGSAVRCERITALIEGSDELQKDVALAIGITPQAFSSKVNGSRAFSLKDVTALADHFHTTVDYLMGRTDTPYPDPWKDKQ